MKRVPCLPCAHEPYRWHGLLESARLLRTTMRIDRFLRRQRPMIPSLHIVGTREMGGAERWFVRFLRAMQRAGEPVEALVRTGSDLARHHLSGIPFSEVPMRTVWDPLSRWQTSRYARRSMAPIVQTYMGRATRLTHLPHTAGKIHIARLGGYYKVPQYRHAHAWIGNTQALRDWLVEQGLPRDRVFHIDNFADPPLPRVEAEVTALRNRIHATASDWLILHPARFVWFKGHANLLEAFARLPREVEGRRARLILLGDGGLRAQLQAQANQLGIMDRIVWAGWQQEPAAWYHLADMVVFPSLEAEPMGNVVLEAWAYGKPLLATAFRGAREITMHGKDTWVVPCEDPAALAAGMERMMRDADLRTHLVERGMRRIVDDFGEAVIIERYRSLYRRLLGA